jgi:hypothetical protein
LGVPSKKPTILIRVQPATKDAFKKAAADYDRSVAWLFEKAGEEWLERNGYLPKGAKKKPRA